MFKTSALTGRVSTISFDSANGFTTIALGAALGLLLLVGFCPVARSASLGVDLTAGTTQQFAMYDTTMGYEFHLSGSALVSGLGFWDNDGVYPTVEVGLWSLMPGHVPALIADINTSDHAVTAMATGSGVGHWYFMSYSTMLEAGDYVVADFATSTSEGFSTELYRIQGTIPLTTNVLTYTRDRYAGFSGCCSSLTYPAFSNTNASITDFFLGGNILLDAAATPLPGALPLFASGLGGLGLLTWRRKRKKAARTAG